MCLSTVYLRTPEGEKLVARDVTRLEAGADEVRCTDILGVRTAFPARVREIDLSANIIRLEANGQH